MRTVPTEEGRGGETRSRLFFTLIPVSAIIFFSALFTPASLSSKDPGTGPAAVNSIIDGLPVPEGSVLDEDTYFNDGKGVVMAYYSNPELTGAEVLLFFDRNMTLWGWEINPSGSLHRSQRYYIKEGVPAIIGVDKKDVGSSFSILIGVKGDWGYMAPMRPE
jgi:hypothetical protein